MGEVQLPYIEGHTAIAQALEVLRHYGRSGIVTEQGERRIVLTDGDLIDALRERGDLLVAEVSPENLTIPIPAEMLHHDIFENKSVAVRNELYHALRTRGAHYAIAPGPVATVRVVTVEEGLSNLLRQQVIVCRCRKNPQRHVYRPAQVASGKCSRDGEPVDCT